MRWRETYTKQALKDLARIERQIADRIVDKIEFFCQQEDPLFFAKKLNGHEVGNYRFRIGSYRVIFDVGEEGEIKVILIVAVKHRREAY